MKHIKLFNLTYYQSDPILILKIWVFNKFIVYFRNEFEVVQIHLYMLFKCKTNVFFLFLCCMSLDFLLEIMCKTCVHMHFKIEIFFKIRAKNIWIFKLRACINAHVNYFSKLMLNTWNIMCSTYNYSKSLSLIPKISGPFWWILSLKYVLIVIWGNDQNEMMVFYFQP